MDEPINNFDNLQITPYPTEQDMIKALDILREYEMRRLIELCMIPSCYLVSRGMRSEDPHDLYRTIPPYA